MLVYDSRMAIHETTDGISPMGALIEHLDRMLNQNGIIHCFTLPTPDEKEKTKRESGEDLLYWLCYTEEQRTEVALIVALFITIYLGKDDADILAAVVEMTVRKVQGERNATVPS